MNENNRLIASVIVALCISYLLWSCFLLRQYDSSMPSGEGIVVGTNVGYPPFVMKDETGTLVGFDVDVMRAVGKKLGKQIFFTDMAFDALLIALSQQKVQAIIGGITLTPERNKRVPFIPYHGAGVTDVGLLFWGAAPEGVDTTSLKAFACCGPTTVCTQAGSVFEELLEVHPSIRIKTLTDIPDLVLDLRYKKSDACLLDSDSAARLARQYTQITHISVPLAPHERPLGFAIGVGKHEAELYNQIRSAVAALQKEGIIAELVRKWF